MIKALNTLPIVCRALCSAYSPLNNPTIPVKAGAGPGDRVSAFTVSLLQANGAFYTMFFTAYLYFGYFTLADSGRA